jgi:hypothetical protein
MYGSLIKYTKSMINPPKIQLCMVVQQSIRVFDPRATPQAYVCCKQTIYKSILNPSKIQLCMVVQQSIRVFDPRATPQAYVCCKQTIYKSIINPSKIQLCMVVQQSIRVFDPRATPQAYTKWGFPLCVVVLFILQLHQSHPGSVDESWPASRQDPRRRP